MNNKIVFDEKKEKIIFNYYDIGGFITLWIKESKFKKLLEIVKGTELEAEFEKVARAVEADKEADKAFLYDNEEEDLYDDDWDDEDWEIEGY